VADRGCSIRNWGAVEACIFLVDVSKAGQASFYGEDARQEISQDAFIARSESFSLEV
jgi:hypothetical protein